MPHPHEQTDAEMPVEIQGLKEEPTDTPIHSASRRSVLRKLGFPGQFSVLMALGVGLVVAYLWFVEHTTTSWNVIFTGGALIVMPLAFSSLLDDRA